MVRALTFCLVLLSSYAAYADDTWSGAGADANWNTAANWSALPASGDNLVFPAGALQLTNSNNITGGTFALITVSGNGYTLGGNALTVTAGLTASAAATGPIITLPITASLAQTFTSSGAGITFNAGGTIAIPATLTLAGAGNFTFTSATTGAGEIIMSGTGNATFATPQTTGGYLINAGTVTFTAAPAALGTVTVGAAGTLVVNGATITAQAPITLEAGAHMTAIAGPIWDKTVTLAGAATVASTSNLGSAFYFQGGFATPSIAGTGPLTLVGGTLAIGQGSTYTGGTHMTLGTGTSAYLGLGDNASLGTGALTIDDACTVQVLEPATGGANAVTVGSAVSTGKPAIFSMQNGSTGAWTGTITLANADSQVNANNTGFTVGVINGPGSLTQSGGGPLIVSGAGTWAGSTDIHLGKIQLVAGGSLPATTALTVEPNATFDLNNINSTIGSLASLLNNVTGTVSLGTATLTTGGNNTSTTFSGTITGTGGVVFTGTGTKLLNTANSYTGPTSVTGGTLLLDAGKLALASAVAVHADATLAYDNGGVSGPVTSTGGTVAPGSTVAPRTGTSGDLSLDSASTFAVVVGGTSAGDTSALTVDGTVALGSAKLSANVMVALTMGDSFVIIQNDGTDAVTGTFAGAAEGGIVSTGGASFKVSYVAGDGNDVSITATSDVAAPDLAGSNVDFAGLDLAGVDLATPAFDQGGFDADDKFHSQEKGCGCELGARAPTESGFALVFIAGVALYLTRRRRRSR